MPRFFAACCFVIAALALTACSKEPQSASPTLVANKHRHISREPLEPAEFERVAADLKAWRSCGECAEHRFTALTEITLARLMATPQFADLGEGLKVSAISAAAMMGIVEFKTPADLVRNWKAWFKSSGSRRTMWERMPAPPPASRAWSTVGVAYRVVASCLPEIVWEADDPVEAAARTRRGWWPLLARHVGDMEFDACVAQESARDPSRAAPPGPPWLDANDPYKGDAARFLEDMFVATLREQQCRGRGADDCIILSVLLAELAPASEKTANVLKLIDPLVRVDATLDVPAPPKPASGDAFKHPWDAYLQSLMRRAAFLRAKLISQLSAPAAWPPDAWLETNGEMAQIERLTDARTYFDGRGSQYQRDSYPAGLSPWAALDRVLGSTTARGKEMRQKLRDQTRASAKERDCKPPGADGSTYMGLQRMALMDYRIARLAAGDESTCGAPLGSFPQLNAEDQPRTKIDTSDREAMAAKIAALIGREGYGVAHEEALASFIESNQERCASVQFDITNSRKRQPMNCSPWITEPQTVRRTLPNSKLSLTRETAFKAVSIAVGVPDPKTGEWIEPPSPARIVAAVAKYVPLAKDALEKLLSEVERLRGLPQGAALFQHPQHAKQLLVLSVNFPQVTESTFTNPIPLYLSRENSVLIVLEGSKATPLWVPPRFGYQYDEGEIYAVSDLDRDGNLEVWFKGSHGECDGEDLKPGIDCSIVSIFMGEQFGNALSWFVRGSKPAAAK
jgi:hypothetical protein